MAATNFVDNVTVVEADWLNEVDNLVYGIFGITDGNATATQFFDVSGTGLILSTPVDVGDPGFEAAGININGGSFTHGCRVNDIGTTNIAQFVIHRHSTTLEPLILGARTNSETSSHSDVTAGQGVFTIYGAGWTGSHYDLFASITMEASSSGTISPSSSPGTIKFKTSPTGSNSPVTAMTIEQDKSVTFAGDVDLSAGTLTLATDQISGNAIDGGTISNFASTGIDDSATGNVVTVGDNVVGINCGASNVQLRIVSTDSKAYISLNDDSTSSGTHVMVGASGDDLVMWAGNTEMVRATSTSIEVTKGIKFPATQVTDADANTLDDYEEGTWTPEFSPASGAFTTLTYQVQSGQYTKIGDTVHVTFYINVSAVTVGTASGQLALAGLPFTTSAAFYNRAALSIGYVTGFSTNQPISGLILHNSSQCNIFYRSAVNGTDTALDASEVTSAVLIYGSLTYKV